MKLGLYMATQWRQGADLGPELANLIEQVRFAKASGLTSLMVGQHFVSSPLQMFQAMPLLARLAAEAEGMQVGPGLLLLPLLNPVIVAEETATLDWLCDGNAIIGLGLGYRQEEFDSIGVPFKASCAAFAIGSMCEMPWVVAGSPSWVTIMRTALPSGGRNSFSPRLKSGLSKTSGGR